MFKYLSNSFSITPTPGLSWVNDSDEGRLACIKQSLFKSSQEATFKDKVDIIDAKKDGQVIVKFLEPFGPEIRGTILLDLEEYLKGMVDPGLTVWLEPLGDRNSLRNLRGIEVKK